MIALISFLLVVLVSMIIVRVGAVALELTGLSKDVAAFQAQSAFSGVGFTTSESEYVVSSPVRRKIIRILMFLGSAGITSAIATLVLMFAGKGAEESQHTLILLIAGLLLLFLFWRSKIIEKIMRKIIKKMLIKFTKIQIFDYNQLLGLSEGYSIGRVLVKENRWLANKTLKKLQLNREGVLVLGIYRKEGKKEKFIGVPRGDMKIVPGDILVCYGPDEIITKLSGRRKGGKGRREHEYAVKAFKLRRKNFNKK